MWNAMGEEVTRCEYRDGKAYDGKVLRIVDPVYEPLGFDTTPVSIILRVRSYLEFYEQGARTRVVDCDPAGRVRTGFDVRFRDGKPEGIVRRFNRRGELTAEAHIEEGGIHHGTTISPGFGSGFIRQTIQEGDFVRDVACDRDGNPLPWEERARLNWGRDR